MQAVWGVHELFVPELITARFIFDSFLAAVQLVYGVGIVIRMIVYWLAIGFRLI